MKRLTLSVLFVAVVVSVSGQVFNTSSTLGRNNFSIGLEPTVHVGGPGDGFMMFFHGGYGIKSGIDLALKLGAGNTTYFGADLEWHLGKIVSLTTGAHNFGNFALDGSLNLAFPLRGGVDIFTGFDMDLIFADELMVPLWLPIGVEIGVGRNMSFILEAQVGLTDPAWHVIGGGVAFYF
jgi:hypothetical protein